MSDAIGMFTYLSIFQFHAGVLFQQPLCSRFVICGGLVRFWRVLLPFSFWKSLRDPSPLLLYFDVQKKELRLYGWEISVCVCVLSLLLLFKSDVRVNRMLRFAVIRFCHIHSGLGGGGKKKDKQCIYARNKVKEMDKRNLGRQRMGGWAAVVLHVLNTFKLRMETMFMARNLNSTVGLRC